MFEKIDSILKNGRKLKIKNSQYLFYRGDIEPYMYFINVGKVETSLMNLHGEKLIIDELSENNFFGYIDMKRDDCRQYNAYAYKDTELILINKSVLREVMFSENSSILKILFDDMALKLKGKIEFLEDLIVMDSYGRVTKKIFEMSENTKTNQLITNQTKIAQSLFLSRQTTNQALQKLKGLGAISISRSCITVLDHNILSKHVRRLKEAA